MTSTTTSRSRCTASPSSRLPRLSGPRPWFLPLALAAIAMLGVGLRLWGIETRPMHTDEAVNAYKTGDFLASGVVRYDPSEHHGPTLTFATGAVAFALGQRTHGDLTEWSVRLPIVISSGLLILALWLFASSVPAPALLVTALVMATHPFWAYYGAYAIHEVPFTLFVLSGVGCAFRFARDRRPGWAIAAGVAAGLAFATKETWVLVLPGLATGVLVAWGPAAARDFVVSERRALAVGAGTAIAVAVLLFASFGLNPRGILDAVLSFTHYAGRASGAEHLAGAAFYWERLVPLLPGSGFSGGLVSALLVIVPAASASALVWGGRRWLRPGIDRRPFFFFLGWFAVTALVITAVPYKTPWNLSLAFLPLCLFMGLVGEVRPRGWLARPVRSLLLVLVAAGSATGVYESHRLASGDPVSESNPWSYAHTSSDILEPVRQLEVMRDAAPELFSAPVVVVMDDPWPWPWYLRHFEQVGYWQADNPPPGNMDWPVLIGDGADRAGAAIVSFHRVRRGVLVPVAVRADAWAAYLRSEGVVP